MSADLVADVCLFLAELRLTVEKGVSFIVEGHAFVCCYYLGKECLTVYSWTSLHSLHKPCQVSSTCLVLNVRELILVQGVVSNT